MRAMQYVGYGDPTQLRMADVPVPKPAPEEFLVRVITSAVNPVDWNSHPHYPDLHHRHRH